MSARGTVLCVDDEPALLTSLEAILKFSGFRVVVATSGAMGLEKLASNRIDVVLLDCCLPDMNGPKVAVMMKHIKPTVPVILSTGEFQEEHVPGTDAILIKPFRPQLLVETILRFLPEEPSRTGT